LAESAGGELVCDANNDIVGSGIERDDGCRFIALGPDTKKNECVFYT